ncbi:CMGC/GSK protein kinase [Vittaforma corneae ATCC 50505]|uniref:CMGC/GSK protein kinase n=1 Tax=Vittaforma corneae (strain ATCC 50505) TaxID=993615 RepID=L2GM70_VITCO|nr:CMGC/GSK protein kinase [Vittaforma corneae ATCC 50505]ELA41941.1 CMGC/GSK protein kinase [Vittaforma corneae ATCC 50505]
MNDNLCVSMLKLAIKEAKSTAGIQKIAQVCNRDGSTGELSYKIIEIIGRGTFGFVSKIETAAGSVYALKTVYENNKYNNRELDILLKIDHPNIIRLHSYFFSHATVEGHYLYMCFEYIHTSFQDFVIDKARDVCLVKHLYRQAVEGLNYLHLKGICHRDIKPSNLLVDQNMNLKICDFGSAKLLRRNESNNHYICTRYYRSPENLMGHARYSTKVDIWALATVFCEFRTDFPIFKGKNTIDVLEKIFEKIKVSQKLLKKYGYKRRYLEKRIEPTTNFNEYLMGHFHDKPLVDVLVSSLEIDPKRRIDTEAILQRKMLE